MHLSVMELLHYTDEERQRWEQWFNENGEDLLKMPIGGRHEMTIGCLILHIFELEMRCVQLLRHEAVIEYRRRPCLHIGEVFGFGLETRKAMRDFVRAATPEDCARIVEFHLSERGYRVSARKIVLHTLLDEVRHWAHVEHI